MKKSILGILLLIAMFLALLVSCNESPENNEAGVFGIPCEINITASEGGSVQFCDYFGVSKHVYTGTEVTVIATANDSCVFIGLFSKLCKSYPKPFSPLLSYPIRPSIVSLTTFFTSVIL